jgi:hypothetical protein
MNNGDRGLLLQIFVRIFCYKSINKSKQTPCPESASEQYQPGDRRLFMSQYGPS